MVVGPAGQLAECRAKARSWSVVLSLLSLLLLLFFKAHQHKAAGRKTRLDIQNYDCNGNLLCDHMWCCGKKPHFPFAEPWKGVGKGMLSLGCLPRYYYYAAFNAPCVGHKDNESQVVVVVVVSLIITLSTAKLHQFCRLKLNEIKYNISLNDVHT